jgi:hypothetical protein
MFVGAFNMSNCRYCGGNCENEPEDSKYLCDGFAGDIDGLYKEVEDEQKNS